MPGRVGFVIHFLTPGISFSWRRRAAEPDTDAPISSEWALELFAALSAALGVSNCVGLGWTWNEINWRTTEAGGYGCEQSPGLPAFDATGFAGGAWAEARAGVGGAGSEGDSGIGEAAWGGIPETSGGWEEAEGSAARGAWGGCGPGCGDAAANGRGRGCDRARSAAGWGMVWAAGRSDKGGDTEREVEVVVRSAGQQAGAGDEGYDDIAAVGVFRAAGTGAGPSARVHVGNHAGGGIFRRKISRGGVCGVFPVCEAGVVAKQWRK